MIEWWGQNFVRPETCYNLIRIEPLLYLGVDLQICFVENILDAVMKQTTAGFLCILEIHYLIGSAFFLCDFKTQTLGILCFHLLSHNNFY